MINPGSIGIVVVAFLALIGLFASQRQIGATKVVAKIERATDNAISKGKRAAAASGSDSVRGQRDPTTRND